MSTPDQPTLLAPPIPSFGGYAPQQGELQGVTFWPRAGARIIDMIVQYIVAFISAFLFGIMLVIASGGHASPAVLAKMDHRVFPASSWPFLAASLTMSFSRRCTEAPSARSCSQWLSYRKTVHLASSAVL